MRRLGTLPLALLLLVFALAACGGGEGEEGRIVEVVERSATSTDPADCEALATREFLEQTQYSRGEQAVESCEENAEEGGKPDSVEVSEVEVDGFEATANTAFEGGEFDGQTFEVALVEEDGDWKMDELTGFAVFDRENFAQLVEAVIERNAGEAGGGLAACVAETLAELPQSKAEELILEASPQPIVEAVEDCEGERAL